MTEPQSTWSPLARVGFRLVFVYMAIYLVPAGQLWDRPVVWLGERMFGVEITIRPNGSGDTTYNYVQQLIMVFAALGGALLWSAIDRKRPSHPVLAEWLIVVTRYYLAMIMLSYGFAKIFVGQFPAPGLETLMLRYGDSSPMRLAWTFMGYSRGYSLSAGLLECLGGMLLFWRRTTTLGALLCAGVMTNVVLMNLCYDIPVKLFSSQLLAMALALVALDRRRLLDLLVLNRATAPVEHAPHFRRRGLRIAGYVVKVVIIGGLLVLHAWSGWNAQRTYTDRSIRSPLYGIYEASSVIEDGQPRPGLISDGERWRYLIFDRPGLMSVQRVDGTLERYSVMIDEQAGSFELSKWVWPMAWMYIDPPDQEPVKTTWTYARPSPDRLELAGELEGRKIEIQAEARDTERFLLVERGFHWINEYPLNR